jgi:hypothetical protein
MSWRNTDRAFGSRPRGLRGTDGLGRAAAWSHNPSHPAALLHGLDGLEGFVPPLSVAIPRWRNTDRSYGNRPRGLPFSGVGMGDTSSTICSSVDDQGNCIGYDTYTAPDAASGASNWPQITAAAQAGFQDVYQVLKLFNPVPPGTVMQTGPGGTFISRAPSGSTTLPSSFSLPSLSGGSGIGILLLVGVGALIIFSRKQ